MQLYKDLTIAYGAEIACKIGWQIRQIRSILLPYLNMFKILEIVLETSHVHNSS